MILVGAGNLLRKNWETELIGNKPNCKVCIHKGTDFYGGLCPQNDAELLPQEGNRCLYYELKTEGVVMEEFDKWAEAQKGLIKYDEITSEAAKLAWRAALEWMLTSDGRGKIYDENDIEYDIILVAVVEKELGDRTNE